MSPKIELDPNTHNFISNVIKAKGEKLKGQSFLVQVPTGEDHVVTITDEGEIASSQGMIHLIEKVGRGETLLLREKDIITTPKDMPMFERETRTDMSIEQLFDGTGGVGTRITKALSRNGVTDIGDLVHILNQDDGEERLRGMRRIGDGCVKNIKQRLGMI